MTSTWYVPLSAVRTWFVPLPVFDHSQELPSQHRRWSIVFRVLFQQTNKQTNKHGASHVLAPRLTSTSSFVCFVLFHLFVEIKPKKLYSASCWEGLIDVEVNPLGVITHGQRHKPRAFQRQRYKPRTCQSMVNTLQVDVLARIPRLTPALYKAQPPQLKGVPPCLV